MLKLRDLVVRYDQIEVLHGISLTVEEGEIVTLVGANGAGKSTILKAISGLLRPAAGEIEFLGRRLNGLWPEQVVALGISQVPEGRRIFPGLTVKENLQVPGFALGLAPGEIERRVGEVLDLFPALRGKLHRLAWSLSGGEQQMLAIGRSLVARPRLLLLDEPSLGLAPVLVDELFQKIKEINQQGTTILLVEQNAFLALAISRRGYVLETGRVVLEGEGSALLQDEQVQAAYLGRG